MDHNQPMQQAEVLKRDREPGMQFARDRLSQLAEELDELTTHLGNAFAPVVFHRPDVPSAEKGPKSIEASEFACSLSLIAERIEHNFARIRELIANRDF